ncbi:MAG TPA: 3'-5' exonuclease, partial [Candidatus Binatus sp.]|nr:3'-5' exonuclease [Candidatus Binatus sp.]
MAIEPRIVDVLLPTVVARMDARKREQGTLDYEDMLSWLAGALDAARGKSLSAALRDRYRFVLIDEFQDTDQLQWAIFRRVFVDDADGNTVYVIGDPKQAIYAFRGADVHAYLDACQHLKSHGATVVQLRENFRSTSDMVDASNLVFDQTAHEPIFDGAIKYLPPVICGKKDLRASAHSGKPITPITLMKFQPSKDRYKFSRRMREAIGVKIAQEIRSIIKDPEHAIGIVNGRNDPRQVTAKDIYVLTRSNRDSAEISKYLGQAGVPYAFYKQEGLFQTREAAWILDVLRGIDAPARRSNRLKAWASPFFAVDYEDLARLEEQRSSHPMLDRLFEWRTLAAAGRFAELFDAMLHRSGLAERELLSADDHRELTNYEHIFEILNHDSSGHGVSLPEIIDRLDAYIAERATPEGDDANVQRVTDERCAVQIMTIHKSKGLEADVVALYGGLYANNAREDVCVFHVGNERYLAIGKSAQDLHFDETKAERLEEEQRLLYVALTRARAKLLLPYIPKGTLGMDITGCYKQLNKRLRTLESESAFAELFSLEDAVAPPPRSELNKKEKRPDQDDLCAWLASTSESIVHEGEFDELRNRHPGLIVASYTSLQAADPEDFKNSVDAAETGGDNLDLVGGRRVGIFLHEALEQLDFAVLRDSANLQTFMARKDVRELFSSAMRRHSVNDQRWLDRGREIIFNALTAPIALGDTMLEDGLCRLPKVSEMEFVYPIPEPHHTLLGNGPNGEWTVGRGYIKGFVDLVFRHDDLT